MTVSTVYFATMVPVDDGTWSTMVVDHDTHVIPHITMVKLRLTMVTFWQGWFSMVYPGYQPWFSMVTMVNNYSNYG